MTEHRVAIVTSDYHVPGETFINRHIALMFGGRTVVVTGRFNGKNPHDRPVFTRRARHPGTALDALLFPFELGLSALRHKTSRVPFGAGKRALKAFLEEHGITVILAEFGTQALVIAPLAAEMGLPCFTYFRGTDASMQLRNPRRVESYRRMMPQLAGVFSVSQFLLDNLAAHGVTHPNAHVVPSGVDVRRFAPGTKVPQSFLAVGRFVEKKAPLITLRAFAEASRAHPGAHLTFIGDGPLLEPAQALARELGADARVTFTGALPHEAVRTKLADTEVFLQHSVTAANGNTEGLPTAIQEAMAAGCITISTRHAGIPEAVEEDVTGTLVAEHDAAGFTAAIAAHLARGPSPERAATARAVALERFDNDILLARCEQIMTETIAQNLRPIES